MVFSADSRVFNLINDLAPQYLYNFLKNTACSSEASATLGMFEGFERRRLQIDKNASLSAELNCGIASMLSQI